MKAVQVSQNKMLRMIDGVSIKDHVTSQSLLKKYNLSSANQLAGEIKLLEAWKSIHIPEYPFQMVRNDIHMANSDRTLRPNSIKIWKDNAKTKVGSESFCFDTARLWNNATTDIKNASSIGRAKSAIKKFARTLEI